MAAKIHSRRWLDKPLHGDGARVLLVIKNPEDLSCYGAILQKLRCQVRSSPSVTEGARCIQREPCDLIILDQGSSRIEERQLLMTAMEVDAEVPVLVLARSYDKGRYEEAMQSGALDYVEGPLSKAEIIALVETFIPRRAGSRGFSASRVKGATPDKETNSKAEFKLVHPAKWVAEDYREELQS